MGLLAAQQLRNICERAIQLNLALSRDKLFFGISPAIESVVRDENSLPADALKIEVERLNEFDEKTADGFLLAIWLINCAAAVAGRASHVKFFQDWAAKVDALPPADPLKAEAAGGIISDARGEAPTDDKIKLALNQLEGSIGSLSRRATNLMVSKRLHDSLHRIQLSVLPLWKRGIDNIAGTPALWRPIVQDRQRELRAETDSMAGESKILGNPDQLRTMAQETVNSLLGSVDKADAALLANDATALGDALFAVRDVVRDDMRSYATKIEVYQEALDLGLLIQNLTQLAEHASEEKLIESARKAASALAAIMQDLDVIGPQHRLWQDLDVQLWLLEEQFLFLGMGPAAFANFNFQWHKVVTAIDQLAGQPPADWTQTVTRLRADFLTACPVPVAKLPDAAAAGKFEDFVLEVRRIFQAVDQRMKDTCNLLREITVELAKI